jgi:hypothetical protein
MNPRAVARAVVLQRQPEQYLVVRGEDGNLVVRGEDGTPVYDPWFRYGPVVVVVPEKLSPEELSANYAHLAGRLSVSATRSRSAEAPSPANSAANSHHDARSPSPENPGRHWLFAADRGSVGSWRTPRQNPPGHLQKPNNLFPSSGDVLSEFG